MSDLNGCFASSARPDEPGVQLCWCNEAAQICSKILVLRAKLCLFVLLLILRQADWGRRARGAGGLRGCALWLVAVVR